MIKALGGIQKIAKVINNIDNLYHGKENKLRYAVSCYSDEDVSDLKSQLKNYFKKEKLKASIKEWRYILLSLCKSIFLNGEFLLKEKAIII